MTPLAFADWKPELPQPAETDDVELTICQAASEPLDRHQVDGPAPFRSVHGEDGSLLMAALPLT